MRLLIAIASALAVLFINWLLYVRRVKRSLESAANDKSEEVEVYHRN